MRRTILGLVCFSALTFCLALVQAHAGLPEYKSQATKDLVALVDAAAALTAKEGGKAFAQLRQKDSRWYKGDSYVFITAPDGTEIVNPAFPELEGKNLYELKDAFGKPYVKQFIKRAMDPKGPGWTWVHYLWHKPGKQPLSWKSSYIKRVKSSDGNTYLVGSGLYDMKMERYFVVQKVEQAAALIKAKGEAAFPELRRRDGEFVFNNTYVFVDSMQGIELVNPLFPGLEGKDIIRLTNEEGRRIGKEYIELVRKKGSGWLGYYWPKPGQTKPSIKHTYVMGAKHGNKEYVVGCGAYLD
jgi:signal transduction histidine kinase